MYFKPCNALGRLNANFSWVAFTSTSPAPDWLQERCVFCGNLALTYAAVAFDVFLFDILGLTCGIVVFDWRSQVVHAQLVHKAE